MKKGIVVALIGLIGLPLMDLGLDRGWAADEGAMTSEDLQIAKVARERLYPAGRDEEDLEVQSQLTKPTRKIGGKKENVESSSNDDEF